MQVTAENRMKRIATHSERPRDGCAYQWPLQPLLLPDLKVTHKQTLSSAAPWARRGLSAEFCHLLSCATIFRSARRVRNRCGAFKYLKIITGSDVLQLLNRRTLSHNTTRGRKKKTLNEQKLFLMLNKQIPSATNYTVRSMKWNFTIALSCQAKLYRLFLHKKAQFCGFPQRKQTS